MSELVPTGLLVFTPDPVQQTRSDRLAWPQETAQPANGAVNTVQPFMNLSYNMPTAAYLGTLEPSGYPSRSVPAGVGDTGGLTSGSGVQQNAAGGALRTAAEAMRQWLLGIRLRPSPFPTVGQQ